MAKQFLPKLMELSVMHKYHVLFSSYWNTLPIPTPNLLVMTPEASKCMSYALWKFAKDTGLLIYPLPKCIFMDITEKNKDYFSKFAAQFKKTVDKK